MVTKERESRPLLNVTPESEFEVQDVNVEGIGGEEGTSQSLQTQMMGEEKEMNKTRIDFICNIDRSVLLWQKRYLKNLKLARKVGDLKTSDTFLCSLFLNQLQLGSKLEC